MDYLRKTLDRHVHAAAAVYNTRSPSDRSIPRPTPDAGQSQPSAVRRSCASVLGRLVSPPRRNRRCPPRTVRTHSGHRQWSIVESSPTTSGRRHVLGADYYSMAPTFTSLRAAARHTAIQPRRPVHRLRARSTTAAVVYVFRDRPPPHTMKVSSADEQRMLITYTFVRSFQKAQEIAANVIHFNSPVIISDIEILSPLNSLVTASGEMINGYTEPSGFSIQFFCNNLSLPHDAPKVCLGSLNYNQEHRTNIKFRDNIWTNKLIVCGRFLTLTVVVYGSPMDPYDKNLQIMDQFDNLNL